MFILRVSLCWALVTAVCGAVFADGARTDREVAQREYAMGAAAYDGGHYEEAIGHFTLAREAVPAPELDYNLGQCFDHLGRRFRLTRSHAGRACA